jgi:hypothetical protein
VEWRAATSYPFERPAVGVLDGDPEHDGLVDGQAVRAVHADAGEQLGQEAREPDAGLLPESRLAPEPQAHQDRVGISVPERRGEGAEGPLREELLPGHVDRGERDLPREGGLHLDGDGAALLLVGGDRREGRGHVTDAPAVPEGEADGLEEVLRRGRVADQHRQRSGGLERRPALAEAAAPVAHRGGDVGAREDGGPPERQGVTDGAPVVGTRASEEHDHRLPGRGRAELADQTDRHLQVGPRLDLLDEPRQRLRGTPASRIQHEDRQGPGQPVAGAEDDVRRRLLSDRGVRRGEQEGEQQEERKAATHGEPPDGRPEGTNDARGRRFAATGRFAAREDR